jgi:peroxiredoxin Q/BCP
VVEEGKAAPDFALHSDTGETVKLSDLRGKPVVLYFYPKDDTPGCTRQACALRDGWGYVEATGAKLFGVSPDDVESHVRFKEKFRLPFPLLADTEHRMAENYGVWVEKTNYGKTSMGIKRSGFVIDAEGRLVAAKRGVKPDDHLAWALAEVEKLVGTPA